MPLCRDCAHCVPDLDARHPYIDARCERLTYADLVSGETRLSLCATSRSTLDKDCGLEGKLFLAKAAFEAADAAAPTSLTVGA